LSCLLWVPVRWSVSALLALLSGAGLLTSDLWEVAPVLSPPLPLLLVGAGRYPGAGTSLIAQATLMNNLAGLDDLALFTKSHSLLPHIRV